MVPVSLAEPLRRRRLRDTSALPPQSGSPCVPNPPPRSAEFYQEQSEQLRHDARCTQLRSTRERLLALAAVYQDLALHRRHRRGTRA